MRPGEAWGAFTVVFFAGLSIMLALLLDLDIVGELEAVAIGVMVAAVYLYILYKRYHVELVPESDILLFDDPEDLAILCSIYGLDDKGSMRQLRERLMTLARDHSDQSFLWVAPAFIRNLGKALRIEHTPPKPPLPEKASELAERIASDTPVSERPLLGGKRRSRTRLAEIKACPICEARRSGESLICKECGADFEFYAVLSESKVGKRLMTEKSEAKKRKLRIPVEHLDRQ